MKFWTLVCATILSAGLTQAATFTVPGTANPWLAGMPDGTRGQYYSADTAPGQSPLQVTGVPIRGGDAYTFFASGLVDQTGISSPRGYGPDGGNRYLYHYGVENGMSNIAAHANTLLGVFLSDDRPDLTGAPAKLVYRDLESRNYAELSPLLKQVFRIGNGYSETLGQFQRVVAPEEATRLFLGVMDDMNWHNNWGAFTVEVNNLTAQPRPVPVPGALSLMGLVIGTLAMAGRRRPAS